MAALEQTRAIVSGREPGSGAAAAESSNMDLSNMMQMGPSYELDKR